MANIPGTIFQMKDGPSANAGNLFPKTVVGAVLGLDATIQAVKNYYTTQLGNYWLKTDVTYDQNTHILQVGPNNTVNLATVTDLSNYYTKTEADERYTAFKRLSNHNFASYFPVATIASKYNASGDLPGDGAVIIIPTWISNDSSTYYEAQLYIANEGEIGFRHITSGTVVRNSVLLDSVNYSSYALPLSGGTIAHPSDAYPLTIHNTSNSGTTTGITLRINDTDKAHILYESTYWGAALMSRANGYDAIGILNDGTPYYGNASAKYNLWHSGNDGAGSGLDADLLDGQHASAIIDTASTNPKSELKTGQEFVFRKTNVEWDAKSGVIKKIKGKTLAWNQIVPIPSAQGVQKVGSSSVYTEFGLFPIISGHKYFVELSSTAPDFTFIGWIDSNDYSRRQSYALGAGSSAIITSDIDIENAAVWGTSAEVGTCDVEINIVDLTLAGIADEISTPADFEALYPGYHEYNPGTLISNDADAVETTGVNQWDEEWESGSIDAGTGIPVVDGNVSRSKNFIPVIPGKTYYLNVAGIGGGIYGYYYLYDENKNFIFSQYFGASTTAAIPANACYLKIMYTRTIADVQNYPVCINLSNPAINGQYFPYKKSRINLGLKNIKVVSPNVWDEVWEAGSYDEYGEPVSSPNQIRSKNFIPIVPNTEYYFNNLFEVYLQVLYYDANKSFISYAAGVNNVPFSLTTPSNAAYIRWRTNAGVLSYNKGQLCINLSNPAFNGRYFPYGTLELKDGVKGNGEWADYVDVVNQKNHKRAGRVDLGSLEWAYENGVFYAGLPGAKIGTASDIANAVCAKYTIESWVGMVDKTLSIFFAYQPGVNIKDSSYSAADLDSSGHASWLEGVMLDFELANEEVYDLAEPIPSVYPCDQFGTERVISPVSVTPSAPFCADIQYGAKSDDVANDLIAVQAHATMFENWKEEPKLEEPLVIQTTQGAENVITSPLLGFRIVVVDNEQQVGVDANTLYIVRQ